MKIKQLQNRLLTLIVSAVLSAITLTANAQTYSVSYNSKNLEQVIKDLRKRTGYEFVYQKQVIKKAPVINCDYKNLNLNEMLNRIIVDAAGLDYEIVKKRLSSRKRATTAISISRKQLSDM